MKPALRELLLGLLFSILSIGTVFGAASIALLEKQSPLSAAAPVVQDQNAAILPDAPETETNLSQDVENIASNAPLIEANPSPTRCATPQGWISYKIRNGDSLELLAAAVNVSVQVLKEANCLVGDSLIPGSTIYLPSDIPSVTSTFVATAAQIACTPPPNWTEHIMQPDENLLSLSQKYHVRIADLISANCYQNATILRAGDTIYLPYPEITTPTPTPVSTTMFPTMQSIFATMTVTPSLPDMVVTPTTH
jgi:LysM repeat protein